MHIICLTPVESGVYNDHKTDHITAPPEGWAYIPEDFPMPSTFPRLESIEAALLPCTVQGMGENGELLTQTFTMMTVTAMTEGTLPEPVEEPPSQLDQIEAQVAYTAMMTDTLLGV